MLTFATPNGNGGQAIIDDEAGFDIYLVGLAGSHLLHGAPLRPSSSSRSRRKQSLIKIPALANRRGAHINGEPPKASGNRLGNSFVSSPDYRI